MKRQAIARVKSGMAGWIDHMIRLRLDPERMVMADRYWNRKSQQRTFCAWAWLVKQWRMSPKEEKALTTKAIKHYAKMTQRYYYLLWLDWLKVYARPKKKKFAVVQAHINKMIMKQAVAAWRCIMHVKWVRRMKFEEATNLSKVSCVKRGFAR